MEILIHNNIGMVGWIHLAGLTMFQSNKLRRLGHPESWLAVEVAGNVRPGWWFRMQPWVNLTIPWNHSWFPTGPRDKYTQKNAHHMHIISTYVTEYVTNMWPTGDADAHLDFPFRPCPHVWLEIPPAWACQGIPGGPCRGPGTVKLDQDGLCAVGKPWKRPLITPTWHVILKVLGAATKCVHFTGSEDVSRNHHANFLHEPNSNRHNWHKQFIQHNKPSWWSVKFC